MTLLVAVLAALAVYRLTLLVTDDVITEPIRDALVQRFTTVDHAPVAYTVASTGDWRAWRCSCGHEWTTPNHSSIGGRATWQQHLDVAPRHRESKLAVLITCPWCTSLYVAFPVVWATLAWSDGWGWWLAAGTLAASGVTGALATAASPD